MSAEGYAKATEDATSIPAELLRRSSLKQKGPNKNPQFEESMSVLCHVMSSLSD